MATNKAGKFFCFIIALISPVHQFQGQEAEDRGPGPAPPQPETPGSSTSLRLCVFLATGRPCCPLCPPHWMAVGTWRANGCERSLEILKVMLKVFAVLRVTEGPEHPQIICPPGLAASSPDSDLTSASVLSGVDRIVSLLWELQAQDPPHTRVEEGQAPLGLSMAVTCQIWSDHRPGGLQAQPYGPESGRKREVYVSVKEEQSRR